MFRVSLQEDLEAFFVANIPADETTVLAAVVVHSPVSKRVSGEKDLEVVPSPPAARRDREFAQGNDKPSA